MKVAITADLHLTAKDQYPERYNALDTILHQVETENIENLLIAGDLFDKEFQNYAEFERLCKKYPNTQLHIIPGNHDADISEKSIVAPNIHIYTVPTPVEIGDVTFLFVPYEGQTKMGEKIASKEEEIRGKKWVLIGHGDYYCGFKDINPLELGTYMPLSRENVVTFSSQAVFLGHIHKPVNRDNVYYVGSPCGLDISETGKRRFLIYDTADSSVAPMYVETDIIYFEESFVIVPLDDEVPALKQEIVQRIRSWNIDPKDYSKVMVRVQAVGYSVDRSAILYELRVGFDQFKYYKDEGPLIDNLSTSLDYQLNAIAERVIKRIDELMWNFGGDEPDREMLKIEALRVIYGN